MLKSDAYLSGECWEIPEPEDLVLPDRKRVKRASFAMRLWMWKIWWINEVLGLPRRLEADLFYWLQRRAEARINRKFKGLREGYGLTK